MASPSTHSIREYLEPVLVAIVVALFVRTFLVQAFSIPTGSMEDNLLVGDHVLVNKFIYAPPSSSWLGWMLPQRPLERGEVAVFKFPPDPGRDFIKRCVARGADVVELRRKRLILNGEEIDESSLVFFRDEQTYPDSVFLDVEDRRRDNFGPYPVPEGHFFCLGDNRDLSHDSRYWGAVPEDHIKGRALMIYWSHGTSPGYGAAGAENGVGGRAVGSPLRMLRETRWDRSFTLVR